MRFTIQCYSLPGISRCNVGVANARFDVREGIKRFIRIPKDQQGILSEISLDQDLQEKRCENQAPMNSRPKTITTGARNGSARNTNLQW